ncbi:unnamed protein product, partial [Ceratitis capitata]
SEVNDKNYNDDGSDESGADDQTENEMKSSHLHLPSVQQKSRQRCELDRAGRTENCWLAV